MSTALVVKVEFDKEKMQEIIEKYIKEHDVVEVVRCGECKWYNHGFCSKLERTTEQCIFQVTVAEDEFCSDGERCTER